MEIRKLNKTEIEREHREKENKQYLAKLKRKLNSNKVSDEEKDTIKEYFRALNKYELTQASYELAVRIYLTDKYNIEYENDVKQAYAKRIQAFEKCDILSDRLRDF